MHPINHGRAHLNSSRQPELPHRRLLPRFIHRENIKKFLRYCRNYGFREAVRSAIKKLRESDVVLASATIPLNLPAYSGETLPLVDKKVSVIIPTKNAGAGFPHLLKKLKGQKGLREIEIIVVDSGSTDATRKTARKEGATAVKIPPEAFNHAYARNRGAECAGGDYLLFMVQDALPLTDRWLWELATALEQNEVVAVSCAEYPSSDCDLFYQWVIWNHYKTLNLDRDRILQWDESCNTYLGLRSTSQINDVAVLFRRDIFPEYGYRKKYAEDLDLGIRLIRAGHRIGFLYSTRVLHSHNRSTLYFLKRSYVDTKYLQDVFPDIQIQATDNARLLFRDIEDLYRKTRQVSAYLANLKGKDHGKLPALMNQVRSLYSKDFDSMKVAGNKSKEDRLEIFIQSLPSFFGHNSIINRKGENRLLPHFYNQLESLQSYISQGHTNVNAFLLSELQAALPKMAALTCGMFIAYLYITLSSSSSGKEFPVELDKALSSDI